MCSSPARALAYAFAPELDEPAASVRLSASEVDALLCEAERLETDLRALLAEIDAPRFEASDCAREAADVVEQSGCRVFLVEQAGWRPCYFIQDGWPTFESSVRQ